MRAPGTQPDHGAIQCAAAEVKYRGRPFGLELCFIGQSSSYGLKDKVDLFEPCEPGRLPKPALCEGVARGLLGEMDRSPHDDLINFPSQDLVRAGLDPPQDLGCQLLDR